MYADFESILEPRDSLETNTQLTQRHVPCSIGFVVVSTFLHMPASSYTSFFGIDCVTQFLKAMLELEKEFENQLFNLQPLTMTVDDDKRFKEENICHLCKKTFTDTDIKVRDHDHFSGKFRGAAHQ